MNIQRMKFALARGARIEWEYEGEWHPGPAPTWSGPPEGWRIYPDDEHLQYGPLSTALREMVVFEETEDDISGHAVGVMMKFECPLDLVDGKLDMNVIKMAMLFYAELLADEGL